MYAITLLIAVLLFYNSASRWIVNVYHHRICRISRACGAFFRSPSRGYETVK